MDNSKAIEILIEENNKKHVELHSHKHQPEEAKTHTCVISCMDYRLNGLDFGKSYTCRNAGGRVTDDMIRSEVLTTRLFAVDTVIIVHHTDCGMEHVDDPTVRKLLQKNLGPARLGEHTPHDKHNSDKYRQSDYVAFLAFEDLEQSVIDDVVRLRNSLIVSKKITILGYIYDVDTGKLTKVKKACEIGKPEEC